MSTETKKPNWKQEQRDLAQRARMVRVHQPEAKRLKFSNCLMDRLPNGQLVRVR